MADYLLLFRGGTARAQASPEEIQANMKRWGTWFEGLAKNGQYRGNGNPLESSGKVLTGASKTVTDGPFAESKDLVGGYALITAGSLDEAVDIARGCPIYEFDGVVEVRPIREMNL